MAYYSVYVAIALITVISDCKCAVHRMATRPLNIAHRGASGTIPEHTLEAYRVAVGMGADYIECDVHLTRDLYPVCLHDPWLSDITNVRTHPEFLDRRTTYDVDSYGNVTDWFAIDFTLVELKTLGIRQRYNFRDSSLNGQYSVPTLFEFIETAQEETSRTVGIYPEVKNPAWHNSLSLLNGSLMEDIVLAAVKDTGYTAASDACFLQSFDEDSARYLASKTSLPVIILVKDSRWENKLAEWSQYFAGVGASKTIIVNYDGDNGDKNWITGTSSLVEDAHAHGLQVHAFTFRNEDRYLAWDFKQDPVEEYKFYQDHGLDGFFTDFPSTFTTFLDTHNSEEETCQNSAGIITALYVNVLAILTLVYIH